MEVFFTSCSRQRQQLAAQRDELKVQRDELASQAEALKAAAGYKDVLLREINHRIKNLFSVTAGLISLSARPARSVAELEADLLWSRLHAPSRAHELDVVGSRARRSRERDRDDGERAPSRAIVAPHEHDQDSHRDIRSDAPLTAAR